jgi:hypothetical protein
MFCKLNISHLKPVFLLEKESAYDICTDASDVGAAGFIKNSHLVMFETWLKLEAGNSSTWREIQAVELCLLSYKLVSKAYRLSELIFLILKAVNIRCFILIADEIVHNSMRK